MVRTLIAATIVYAYGLPVFDGYRPAVFDKPLQTFDAEINGAANTGKRTLGLLDDGRCMHYLKIYIARIDAQLRGEKHD
jgi:hypothetical protein